MIPVYKKMEFIDFLLSKSIITNEIAYTFFRELYKDTKLLQKVHFSKYALNHMKYSITINTTKKYIMCKIDGKFHKSYRILNYILRAMEENPDMTIGISIICLRAPFEIQYEKVCHNIELVEQFISSVVVESILDNSKKDFLRASIDKALDEGNKELFMKLSSQYKDLL